MMLTRDTVRLESIRRGSKNKVFFVNSEVGERSERLEVDVLTTLRSFAAGELKPCEFRERLYADPGFVSFLANDPKLDLTNYVKGSAHQFLLECDFDEPGGILNAHGAVCDFLDRNGYKYKKTDKYASFHELVIKASPHWLAADLRYVQDMIMPDADGRTGHELHIWLTEQLLEKYRFISKPPEWIQGPCWPHGEAGPLVFLGQLEVDGYFHDFATVYVFHDQVTGNCETIIQCF
jgi:hypothetical protein